MNNMIFYLKGLVIKCSSTQSKSDESPIADTVGSLDSENADSNGRADISVNTSTIEDDGKSSSNSNVTVGKKEEYLKKLNEMKELQRNSDAKTTTLIMEEEEAERYKTWDEALNEIYGVLKNSMVQNRCINYRRTTELDKTHR
ncbi:hypothetical protein [Bacillus sp. FSL K6-3431]|uniref:hypothetical protein n=1 Tax=Bacillus sp. FSL K6-3431 TaxID=2921500 RepID=UPI0030FBCA7D